ncbi:hypothetical protein RHSIM_RhsimUnG0157500 [Rhododendron simsii]|uniref:Uncharacterized protein n=1 Tax=Rhododendron simsii TaxID=118357 RepID=A0A834L400_RHOSS|nr:hypothetical protein RHSIM_RhsimUnG0157500 [Rhododendron simsii]
MGSRIPSHQLSSGLYVSGRPDLLPKSPQPTMSSRAVPYTGGDIKTSGELGKMFDLTTAPTTLDPTLTPRSRLSSSSQHNSGSVRSGPNSGPILHPTGLITSGPLTSSAGRRSGQLDPSVSMPRAAYGSAVTKLGDDAKLGFNVSKPPIGAQQFEFKGRVWFGRDDVKVGFNVSKLPKLDASGQTEIFVVNYFCLQFRRRLLSLVAVFLLNHLSRGYRDVYILPQNCTNIEDWVGNQQILSTVSSRGDADMQRLLASCGQKYVADFYISDFQSGLRALVKAGYGAKVAAFVKPTTIVNTTKENREPSPSFLRWLADHSLSSDDRRMRLQEGYIKEGSTVSVMGIVRRHDNVLMIVPSPDPVSAGCRWAQCLLPTYIEGLILTCDESEATDVIPV